MNPSSKPLTQAEATALEIAVVERKATIDDVRTVLDTDDWFAGCSIDELDPNDVERVVRWVLRREVGAMILMSGTLASHDWGIFPVYELIRDGEQHACGTDSAYFEKAVRSLLEQLRVINRRADLSQHVAREEAQE
jgi:hypothetical protein